MSALCERFLESLDDADAATLTGWTHRVARSVVHLADAWTIADDQNAPLAVAAIGVLLLRLRPAARRIMLELAESAGGGSHENGGRGSELVGQVELWIERWSRDR